MLGAMHAQCATHMPDAMHERTNELTNAEHPQDTRGNLSVSNARGDRWIDTPTGLVAAVIAWVYRARNPDVARQARPREDER